MAKFEGPNISAMVQAACGEFAGYAARRLKLSVQSKLGTYQAGWPALAKSTIRKKAKRRHGPRAQMLKRNAVFGPAYSSDAPLVDKGEMARGISGFARGTAAHVTAPFPMHVHEQDFEVADFRVPPNNLPARPVLGPALEENIDPLTAELEQFMVERFI